MVDKIQGPFIIKTLNEQGLDRNFFNLRYVYTTPITNIFNEKNTDAFVLRARTPKCLFSVLLRKLLREFLAIRGEKVYRVRIKKYNSLCSQMTQVSM